MLRIIKLTKALPKLRSIVTALLEGFNSVGWFTALMLVFNYIMTCFATSMFQRSDPFHFGSLMASALTIWRIETLDTWETVLNVNMFGCDVMPGAYPFTNEGNECDEPFAYGWLGAAFFVFLVVVGGLVLPTVLIGIITIAFEKSARKRKRSEQEKAQVAVVVAKARKEMPEFFTTKRLKWLQVSDRDHGSHANTTHFVWNQKEEQTGKQVCYARIATEMHKSYQPRSLDPISNPPTTPGALRRIRRRSQW